MVTRLLILFICIEQEDVDQLRWRMLANLIFSLVNTHEASKQEVENIINEES
jgi:hypothetical protein